MKFILAVLSFLVLALFPAHGEVIGNVEYYLPSSISQEWEISNKLESPKGVTLIYSPKGVERHQATEFFGVNSNTLSLSLEDFDALKNGLAKMFPDMEISVGVIEKGTNSLLYEWSAKENDQVKILGWGKVFALEAGSVVLTYLTENVDDASKVYSLWIPVLKEAKIL